MLSPHRCGSALRNCGRGAHPKKIMGILQERRYERRPVWHIAEIRRRGGAMGTMAFTAVGGATLEFLRSLSAVFWRVFVVSWLWAASLAALSLRRDGSRRKLSCCFCCPSRLYLIAEHIGVQASPPWLCRFGMTITRLAYSRRQCVYARTVPGRC